MTLQFGPSILGAKIVVDDRSAASAFDRLHRGIVGVRTGMRTAATDVARFGVGLGSMATSTLAAVSGVGALGFGLGGATRAFLDFETSIAKIGTLLPVGTDAMAKYGDTVRDLSKRFGQSAEAMGEGLFQAISASVPAGEASRFLETAAKAATGGFTSMTTAVDGLTTVINAYGLQADSAERISDAFFLANKAGKTTFDELSRTLGNVVPIAAAVGVSYQDVAASIAAVTKQGIQTSVVTTGLRQALAAILKPSSEAVTLAKHLKLQFGETALRGQGFEQFLQSVAKAAGGSASNMVTLFGSVEAANIVMALTSKAGFRDFTNVLHEMLQTMGQTGAAYDVVARTGKHKLQRLGESVRDLMSQIGRALMDELSPSLDEAQRAIERWIPRVSDGVRALVDGVRAHMHDLATVIETAILVKAANAFGKLASGVLMSYGQAKYGEGGWASNAAPVASTGGKTDPAGAFSKLAGQMGTVTLIAQTAIVAAGVAKMVGEAYVPGFLDWITGGAEDERMRRSVGPARVGALMGTTEDGALGALTAMLRDGGLLHAQAGARLDPGKMGYQDKLQMDRVIRAVAETVQREVATTEDVPRFRWKFGPGGERGLEADGTIRAPRDPLSVQADVADVLTKSIDKIIADVKATPLADVAVLNDLLDLMRIMSDSTDVTLRLNETMINLADVQRDLVDGVWASIKTAGKWTLHHIIKDNSGRDHAVRASRGDGIARHLNPRYRVTILRGGAAAGIIEPLAENYHAPHLINGGG